MAISAALFVTPITHAAKEEAPKEASQEKASSEEAVKTTLEISEVWTRQSFSPNNNSAAYMKVNNPTNKQITIIGAYSSIANNVELHKSFVDEKGISRMVSIDNIVVPAQSQIELKPGGAHIMLFDLRRHLKPGDKFPMIIKIQNQQPLKIESVVK